MQPTIMLTTEGTYPYSRGGVSTWCQQLLESLPDYRFRVVALVGNPYLKALFTPPRNAEVLTIPLWGSHGDIRSAFSRQRIVRVAESPLPGPDDDAIREGFLGPFLELLEECQGDLVWPVSFGDSLGRLHEFFGRYDYRRTFSARPVFDAFGEFLMEHRAAETEAPTVADQKLLLTLLARFLLPASVELPPAQVTHATVAGWSALLGVIAKVRVGRPLLLTEHGVFLREQLYFLDSQRELTDLSKRFLKRLTRALVSTVYDHADRVLPVCGFNARWERALGVSPSKIHVVHNGIPSSYFAEPEALVSPGALDGEIVSISNINPMKDTETAIRAIRIVADRHPDVHLTVYGPIKHERYHRHCRELIRELGLERNVRLAGPTADVRSKLKPFAISLHISISEALPYAILESMAAGQAIVATGVGGVPEALKGAGLLVPVRDHRRVAEACLDLLDHPAKRTALAREANRRAQDFELDRMLGSYDSAYRAHLA